MIETLTVITISLLLLIYFRPGKTPPLDNPLIIERIGKYQIVLPPRLNLAQPYIEAIANKLDAIDCAGQNTVTQFFSVHDQRVKAHGSDEYLLAITCRDGMLYFQASPILMKNQDRSTRTIGSFQQEVMGKLPFAGKPSKKLEEQIADAIQAAAQDCGIKANLLPPRHISTLPICT